MVNPRAVVWRGSQYRGSTFVAAHLQRTTAEHQVLLDRIPHVPDVQSPWLLLLHCASARANHLLWVVSPGKHKNLPTPDCGCYPFWLKPFLTQNNPLQQCVRLRVVKSLHFVSGLFGQFWGPFGFVASSLHRCTTASRASEYSSFFRPCPSGATSRINVSASPQCQVGFSAWPCCGAIIHLCAHSAER